MRLRALVSAALAAVLAPIVVACGPPRSSSAFRYVVPVAPGVSVSYGGVGSHHDYPAADVFASTSCGTPLVSPVDGTVVQIRPVNRYDPAVDNPAYRGGKTVAIVGVDGVRYYLAHMEAVEAGLREGQPIAAGQLVGIMGQTGRAGACHVHLGLSPTCPGKEWAIRRGVIWPQPYLDAWRAGITWSPKAEVEAWAAAHPDACALAMSDPNAPDA